MDDKKSPTISLLGVVTFLIVIGLGGFVISIIADSFFTAPTPEPEQETKDVSGDTQEVKEFGMTAYLPQAYSKIYNDDKGVYYQTDDGRFLAFRESIEAPLFISMPDTLKYTQKFSDRAKHEMASIYEEGDRCESTYINRGTEEILVITKASNKKDPFQTYRTTQRMDNTTTTYCFTQDGRCIIVDAPADEVATILHSASFGQLKGN